MRAPFFLVLDATTIWTEMRCQCRMYIFTKRAILALLVRVDIILTDFRANSDAAWYIL